jgi:hypothetical protein
MSPLCDRCGRGTARDELRTVDVTDDGGACLARLCGGCYALLGRERCRLCGGTKSEKAKAGHVIQHGGREPGGPICDTCRRDLLADGVVR